MATSDFFYAIANLKLSNAMVFTYIVPGFYWALTRTKSPEKILFNFCFIGTLISNVLALEALFMGWTQFANLCRITANIKKIFMSNAYKLAPAG